MIGERIKQLRVQKGFSISKLAQLAQVSKSYLSYIERSRKNNPSLLILSRLAAILGTSMDYLLGQPNEQETQQEIEASWTGVVLAEKWAEAIASAIEQGMRESMVDNRTWEAEQTEGRRRPDVIVLQLKQ